MAAKQEALFPGASTLQPEQLRRETDPGSLGFKTTASLEPLSGLIGQDRALGAIQFGTSMSHRGYNLFVLGPQGFGRHSAVLNYLREQAATMPAPDDWVYVNNFTSSHKPKALRLPAGMANRFQTAMQELVDDLRLAVPAAFQAADYRERRRSLDGEFEERQEQAFDDLREKAEARDIAILRTPMGFALAPTSKGQVIKPDVFNAMPEATRSEIEKKISELQEDLRDVLEHIPIIEKEHRDQLRKLNADTAGSVVDASISSVSGRFSEISVITEHLADVRKDIVERAELFLERSEAEQQSPFPQVTGPSIHDPRFSRYLVNVMVSNDEDGDQRGAPLVVEDHPTLANIVGRVEHQSQQGALVTDFTMIRPGALHQANGGFLVLDARKVLSEMFSWEALKRALRGQTITIVSPGEQLSLISTVTLQPEPVALDVKVVLIGERILYYLLAALDPEFVDLFKVQADFSEEMPRTGENAALYGRLIATIGSKENLLPFNAAATARIIDEAVRMAHDAERISLQVGRVTDLLREADHWARAENRRAITPADVDRAVDQQIRRADRLRELSHEAITRGTVLVATDGEAIGQVNGLSVIGLGTYSFGRPTRITARTRPGSGKVVDIERETRLGGPLHSKGVLILTGFLAASFALDAPMSLWASLVFEQSYGGVEGDSASSAELYALLSSLAGVPLRQSLAVTGSVNQRGEVQAIGGVNEKIEGFFDICAARGLTGEQGVLIPASNVKHLMLRKDVVEAVSKKQFNVYPVTDIAGGIELLSGIEAGAQAPDGTYPADSVFGHVEKTLCKYADIRRKFPETGAPPPRPEQD